MKWLLIVLLALPLEAATYYVRIDGNDANTGTSDSAGGAWRTIANAENNARAGDTVNIRAGTYYETIVCNYSGSANNPIVFSGELDDDGQRLVTVHGGSLSSASWVSAPEVGAGVYKTSDLSDPGMIIYQNFKIPRIDDGNMTSPGFDILARSQPTFNITPSTPYDGTSSTGVTVNFWDSIFGLYGVNAGTTYIRFKDDLNPNNLVLYASSADNGWYWSGQSHVRVENIISVGAKNNFRIDNTSNNIVIRNCLIRHGADRVLIEDDSYANVVEDCTIESAHFGADQGTWGGGSDYNSGIHEHNYRFYKYVVDTSTSADTGVELVNNGDDNIVRNNVIRNGSQGTKTGNNWFVSTQRDGTLIYGNTIYNHSSIGITLSAGNSNFQVFDNTLYNNNKNIRHHRLSEEIGQNGYVYNNRLWQEEGRGDQIFFFWNDTGTDPPANQGDFTTYYYHNSFHGGSDLVPNSRGDDFGGLKDLLFINNIFSCTRHGGTNSSNATRWIWENESAMQLFDYNWVGGAYTYGVGVWSGPNNINSQNSRVWSSGVTDFVPPLSHPVVGSAVDLSINQTIQGQSVGPLPGMTAQYYTGANPSMGSIQEITTEIYCATFP
jgi:hypothetical protein